VCLGLVCRAGVFDRHPLFKKKNMSGFIKFEITLTWSKIVALLMLMMAFVLDLVITKSATTTMYAIPFVVTLIAGKQYLDKKKDEKINTNK